MVVTIFSLWVSLNFLCSSNSPVSSLRALNLITRVCRRPNYNQSKYNNAPSYSLRMEIVHESKTLWEFRLEPVLGWQVASGTRPWRCVLIALFKGSVSRKESSISPPPWTKRRRRTCSFNKNNAILKERVRDLSTVDNGTRQSININFQDFRDL